MKLNLKKDLDILKTLDISCFKKVLKPIKVTNTEKFIDILIDRSQLLLGCLYRGFDIEDYDNIDFSCVLTCNIPIDFSAQLDNGANCWITGEKKDGDSLVVHGYSDKAELIEFLEDIKLPNKIIFKTFELKQRIGNSKSKFTLSIED